MKLRVEEWHEGIGMIFHEVIRGKNDTYTYICKEGDREETNRKMEGITQNQLTPILDFLSYLGLDYEGRTIFEYFYSDKVNMDAGPQDRPTLKRECEMLVDPAPKRMKEE